MKKIALWILILYLPFLSAEDTANHILFLMQRGKTSKALQAYEAYVKKEGKNDFSLLEKLGLILLDQGLKSQDKEVRLMTLYGAGISMNEKALYIIEDSLQSQDPDLQLIALNFLDRYQNVHSDLFLHKAMLSSFFAIRLEAVLRLAQNKDSKAIGHLEGLMAKVPEELWPIFPQFFAALGTPQAKKTLRKLLSHPGAAVRIATIIAIVEEHHDDFLPDIRKLSTHHGSLQQEVCAFAFGAFKDAFSMKRLMELSSNPNPHVKIAANFALYELGNRESIVEIEKMAKEENPFAITLLGKIQGSNHTLKSLLKASNINTQLNAALSLLALKDQSCQKIILNILIPDCKDLSVMKITSPGNALSAYKYIPSSAQNLKDDSMAQEIALHMREEILRQSVDLPEEIFLSIAGAIFENAQNDLLPTLAEVLINHQSKGTIALLEKYQQKAGAPLVRNYCNLSLFRLREKGPYAENLKIWVAEQPNAQLICFRKTLPLDLRENKTFDLTPQETSRLLLETFESFAKMQDDKGVNMLISLSLLGNPKNTYALIGLLLRAIQ